MKGLNTLLSGTGCPTCGYNQQTAPLGFLARDYAGFPRTQSTAKRHGCPLTQSEISRLLEERHPGSTRGSCPAPTAANIASCLRQFEEDLGECDIPPAQWQETAFMVLPGTIRTGMMKRRRRGRVVGSFKDAIAEAAFRMLLLSLHMLFSSCF